MSRCNHFMVHELVLCTEMAFQAFLSATNHVARICHPQRDGFFMLPGTRGVRAEPRRSRPMAILAGHAFGNFKRTPALLRSGVERVAGQAFRGLLGLRALFQDASHAL